MRRIRYCVAMSLDGYIAGPDGEFDWIVMDPDIDFAAMSEQFDTYLLGRRTFEVTSGHEQAAMPDGETFVISRTLRQSDHDDVTIVGENWRQVLQSLREEEERTSGCSVEAPCFGVSPKKGSLTRWRSPSSHRARWRDSAH